MTSHVTVLASEDEDTIALEQIASNVNHARAVLAAYGYPHPCPPRTTHLDRKLCGQSLRLVRATAPGGGVQNPATSQSPLPDVPPCVVRSSDAAGADPFIGARQPRTSAIDVALWALSLPAALIVFLQLARGWHG